MKKTICLIDADNAAWTASFYGAGPRDVESRVHQFVNRACNATGGQPLLCFGDPSRTYFRHRLWPDYKKNRRGKPTPEYLPHAREILRKDFKFRELPELEADDVIGILATHPKFDVEKIIVGEDKDLKTIPGLHFNPATRESFLVTQAEADQKHLTQTLAGDGGDGYPGCPGIGPKKAAAILAGPARGTWARIVATFALKGLTEFDALIQAQVARILRYEDYDTDLNALRPWLPHERFLGECPRSRLVSGDAAVGVLVESVAG